MSRKHAALRRALLTAATDYKAKRRAWETAAGKGTDVTERSRLAMDAAMKTVRSAYNNYVQAATGDIPPLDSFTHE